MIFDFHTHSFLSDGENSPIELIRFAAAYGYSCIAITDHASYSNIDFLVQGIRKDCEFAEKYWNIKAIPGVELTNVPAGGIKDLAREAKGLGERLIAVHGETIVEEVEPGTNLEAVKSEYVDMLAHPGQLSLKEAELAVKHDTFIEITSRVGHSLTNGAVVKIGRQAGVDFLINSYYHSHRDLFRHHIQEEVARGSGFDSGEVKEITRNNYKKFLKKIGY